MILTEIEIREALKEGKILVHDGGVLVLEPNTIKDQSIDVRLGRYIYVQRFNAKLNIVTQEWVDLSNYDYGFTVYPGDFIIAHTDEFIGTSKHSGILPTFKLKSSAGRLGIIHTLAGHGEVGYTNRWAMEFIVAIPVTLKRWQSIGQIYFTKTMSEGGDYSKKGTYQKSDDIEEIVEGWRKEQILPPEKLKEIIYLKPN